MARATVQMAELIPKSDKMSANEGVIESDFHRKVNMVTEMICDFIFKIQFFSKLVYFLRVCIGFGMLTWLNVFCDGAGNVLIFRSVGTATFSSQQNKTNL